MSGVACANVIQGFAEEDGTSVLTTSPPSLPDHAPRNAPPPAPPLPVAVDNLTQGKRRVRSFYWKPIPEERVKQHDRRNIWTLGRHSREPSFRIDVRAIEELFGQHDDMLSPTATSIKRRVSVKDVGGQMTILDSKRSMNISIFIKHFKKSSECLVDVIRHGNRDVFSVETLRELLRLLPDDDEVKKLKMFNGDPKHLTAADAFIYQLIHVPRYEVRIEALLLKEEFNPSFTSMKHDISVILTAIKELLDCEELHCVLHLVLQAGNIMNDGGYAGNAVGFKLSSLLSLADTKANKPGMNLLHFVALESEKKDLLMFPEKLLHVENAARVCVDSIHVELSTLSSRIHQMEEHIHTDRELLTQMQAFLQSAGESLVDLRVSLDEMVNEGNTLIDFFCEDKETFKLDECFQIFQNFCSKFRKAVQENVERGMWEESRRKRLQELEVKRHSWAGHEGKRRVFGLCSSSEADVEAALKREGLLDLLQMNPQSPLRRFGSVRRSWQHKVKTESANCHNMNFTLILPSIHTLSITNSSINTASNSLFLNNANTNTDSNTSTLGHNGNHTHNSIPKYKSDQDYNTSMNLEPENQKKIKETQEDNLQTQTKHQDTPNLTSDPSQTGLNQSERPPRDDESVYFNSQHTIDLLESLKTSSRPSQFQTSSSRSSTKTLGSKLQSSANSPSTKTPSTSEPSSTKSPSMSEPPSTKSPSTSKPSSTKSPSSSKPSSTKSPSTSKPSSTKSPSTSKPSSTKSPSSSKPPSTKSHSTSKPPPTKSPSTSKPPSTKSPSTSKPPPTKSPSTSKPPSTKSPSTSKPPPTKSPSTSKPPSTKSPSTSKPSSTKSHSTSKPSSTKSPSTSKPSSTKSHSTSKPPPTKSPSTSKPPSMKSPSTSKPSSTKSHSTSKPPPTKSPSTSKPSTKSPPTSKPPSTKSPSMSKPSSSSTKPKSSPQGSIRTLTSSETQSLRKVVPISYLNSSGPQIQERKTSSRSSLNSSGAKKRQAIRPPPEEKMCRSTLRALAISTSQNSSNNSANKPAPSFTRNTVASTTRHAVIPGNPSAGRPALTRAASLRLSQALEKQQTPASTLSRAGRKLPISENSDFSHELH
ncbi:FH2 domain-containing protein 1 [Xyrauchen texanus]|uniref:FH2 domain-containing protein 1 n=1 Tax=Xyrauchen texanus TaxID=154827 RepID=UPI00224223FC|nr:FH2 domain-containing protein 1 [Xyrauchen texanus]